MIVFKAHGRDVARLKWSPDGRFLATLGRNKHLCLWSTSPVELLFRHASKCFWPNIEFSPDSRYLAHSDSDRVIVWDLAFMGGEIPLNPNCPPEGIVFSKIAPVLFANHGSQGEVLAWNLPSGSLFSKHFAVGLEHQALNFGAFGYQIGPCNNWLVTTTFENATADPNRQSQSSEPLQNLFLIMEMDSGKVIQRFRSTALIRHLSPKRIELSPDHRHFAAFFGPQMRIWRMGAEQEIANLSVQRKLFRDFRFNHQGNQLLSVSGDTKVRVWDTETWTRTGAYDWQIGKLTCIDVAPDGLRYAAGGSSGKVVVWDAE